MTNRTKGIVEILVSGLCFGFLGLFGKRALGKGIEPAEFLAFRYLLAAVMMGLFVAVRGRQISALWLGWKTVLMCVLLGIVGYAVFSSFYFLALQRISASMTVILLYTYPVFVSIGGAVFFRERIPLSRFPALPMAFAGLVCLVWMDVRIGQPVGLIFGVLAAIFYSVYILLSSLWLKGIDAMVSTFWIQLGAGLALFIYGFSSFERSYAVLSGAWSEILMIAFICSVLAMSLFLSGLLKVQNWEASLLSMAEPFTGVAVGIIVLDEVLTNLQWVGAGLVLSALALVALPVRKRRLTGQESMS